jgi:chaperone required for assembly of F1-ATPase
LKAWNHEKLAKEQEQQLVKRKIHEVEQKTPSNSEKEGALKDKVNEIEKERFELELKGKQFNENAKKFIELKKRYLREIAQAESECQRHQKENEDLQSESIP